MLQVYAEYHGDFFTTLLRNGWVHWCSYVDEHGMALMVKSTNADLITPTEVVSDPIGEFPCHIHRPS